MMNFFSVFFSSKPVNSHLKTNFLTHQQYEIDAVQKKREEHAVHALELCVTSDLLINWLSRPMYQRVLAKQGVGWAKTQRVL